MSILSKQALNLNGDRLAGNVSCHSSVNGAQVLLNKAFPINPSRETKPSSISASRLTGGADSYKFGLRFQPTSWLPSSRSFFSVSLFEKTLLNHGFFNSNVMFIGNPIGKPLSLFDS